MQITDSAKQFLVNVMESRGAEGIRLYSVMGCCGPQYSLSLDGSQESDTIQTINGIQVAIESQIVDTDELVLDQEDGNLVLLGSNSGC